ncbi:MAG: glycoside hydrolase family 2 protein [Pirellulales bacterium]|nr:glycoside hydrolase family 2 protein [Pirellulales bacterium]
MQKRLLVVALFGGWLCSAILVSMAHGAARVEEDLSKGWRFLKADVAGADSRDYQERSAKWEDVDLPHTWNIADCFDDEPGYHRGVGWYRREFTVPENWRGKRVVLRFEAACMVATVWVNGELLGQHKGSWTPFEFDVTDLVEPGSKRNLVAVQVDNRWRRDVPPHFMDFNIMGGLHREVYLIATDPAHIVSTRVTTPEVSASQAVVALETEIRNDGDKPKTLGISVAIEGPGLSEPIVLSSSPAVVRPGQTLLVKQKAEPIQNPKLWSPDEPNLYRVSFRLCSGGRVVDDVENPLGFRWFEFDAKRGFVLNGKLTKLRGVNRHDDYPGLGWALPQSRQIEDMKLIKELGANFVRLAHYPQHPIVLDTCDKLGLLVWEEVPFDGEGRVKAPVTGAKDYAKVLRTNLREMIRRDRNHPSIILWSLGNENLNGSLQERKTVAALTRELKEIVTEEDPTRATAVAINKIERAQEVGLDRVPDVLGYNIYYGWYSGQIEDFGKTVDKARQRNLDKLIIISEYGAGIERGLHTDNPKRMDFSEEHGCRFHEGYLNAIDQRPFIAGSLAWNVFDFAAEHRAHDGKKKQTIPYMNQKGIYTYDRKPKDIYYLYRSRWTDEPMVYVVSHTWTQRKAGMTPIRVYSNCDEVELSLNGKSLGMKSKEDVFQWNVPLGAGENELRAVAKRGEKRVVDTVRVRCD